MNDEKLTATERLRALLDERGVRHADYGSTGTFWTGGSNVEWGAEESGRHWTLFAHDLTPEQAVDATLGCEPNDKEMLRLHDRLNVALLRLERNVDNGNERIAAIAEAHELLEDAATLGRGTCKMDAFGDVRFCDADDDESNYEYGMLAECSECGAIVLMPPEYAHFDRESLFASTNFCPNCGRRVVNEQ